MDYRQTKLWDNAESLSATKQLGEYYVLWAGVVTPNDGRDRLFQQVLEHSDHSFSLLTVVPVTEMVTSVAGSTAQARLFIDKTALTPDEKDTLLRERLG